MWCYASARHPAWQVGQGDVGSLVLGDEDSLLGLDVDYDQFWIEVVKVMIF